MYAVIMAGGSGKRFWPRSRKDRPKQLLDIVTDKSMLKITYERLKQITSPNKIFIVAGEHLLKPILNELPGFRKKNYIVEPYGKNTAPCIGLAATVIMDKDPDAVMGIFPADHLIREEHKFQKAIEDGLRVARDHVSLVTFGIQPNRPATGYGYIQFDKNNAVIKERVYKVKTFAEKPNLETAKRFLETGEFLWNSGMFIWKGITIMNAIKHFIPGLHDSLQHINAALNAPQYKSVLKKEWATIHSTSVDYGIMEKSKNVYVVKGNFEWSDVGSWDAVYELKDKDIQGNIINGNVQTLDTEGCFIHSRKCLITTIGVKDLIVIKSGGAILIVNRNESERVKELVDQLKHNGYTDYI